MPPSSARSITCEYSPSRIWAAEIRKCCGPTLRQDGRQPARASKRNLRRWAPWGLPAFNTLILLTSGVTVTWAHWALKLNKRGQLKLGLFLTFALGFLFVGLQAYEYGHAYSDLNLKLTTGAYGATFFMLTGFHGFHVTLGSIMLLVIFFRVLAGHFKPENHFGFEGVAWYWHFVDVVWLGLFIFVYWLI